MAGAERLTTGVACAGNDFNDDLELFIACCAFVAAYPRAPTPRNIIESGIKRIATIEHENNARPRRTSCVAIATIPKTNAAEKKIIPIPKIQNVTAPKQKQIHPALIAVVRGAAVSPKPTSSVILSEKQQLLGLRASSELNCLSTVSVAAQPQSAV